MTIAARKTRYAFDTAWRLHKMLGETFACSWEAYRQELIETYEVDPGALDAMYRLGHFITGPNFVRFRTNG